MLCSNGTGSVSTLHKNTVRMVNAVAQAEAANAIIDKLDSNELAEEIGRFGVTSYAAGSVSQGFSDLIRLSEGGVGIICGSLYLASQILTEQLPKL